MSKTGHSSAALEVERTAIEKQATNGFERGERFANYFFVVIAAIFVMGAVAAIISISSNGSNHVSIPDGCAVVDNLSACHQEQRQTVLFLGEYIIFGTDNARVCEKKLVCQDGTMSSWPKAVPR